MIKKFIKVSFQKEGVHFYPEASLDPKLKTGDWDDVSFLGNKHFHYFYFYCTIEVFHDNREIEFIQFRRWLERLYDKGVLELNNKSCEMIAEELLNKIRETYPNRDITVEVFEDNINGSAVQYKREEKL